MTTHAIDLISLRHVAEALGISYAAAKKRLQRGKLPPPVAWHGKRRRWSKRGLGEGKK